jgi:hypothetical protein
MDKTKMMNIPSKTLSLISAALIMSTSAFGFDQPAATAEVSPVVSRELISTGNSFSGEGLISTSAQGYSTHMEINISDVECITYEDGSCRFILDDCSEQEHQDQPLLPILSQFIEIPPTGNVRLYVDQISTIELKGKSAARGLHEDIDPDLAEGRVPLENDKNSDRQIFTDSGFDHFFVLGSPVIMRDIRMVSLNLNPIALGEEGLELLSSASIRLEYGVEENSAIAGASDPLYYSSGNEKYSGARSWSGNMEQIYEGLIPNHGQFYDFVDDSVFPVYLIVCPANYMQLLDLTGNNLQTLINWKREKGFDVRIVSTFDINASATESVSFGELRNWMRDQWTESRPEFLLLIGDDDDDGHSSAAMPDSVVQSSHSGELDVSDHFYALQEGDDYFPELFVGRLSVDSMVELNSIAIKPVIHESQPPPDDGDWLSHGLVVSCNYSDSGNHPVTPNLTSRWVIDKLRANDFTITAADSLFFPPLADGGALITSALNEGRGIVSYRGWANSNGWIYPEFVRDDVNNLSNVYKMPIVASFVCQTGAYGAGSATSVEDPCFGESWIRAGHFSAPTGAVAFIGPSDLHTRSQYNNPVCSGFFNAIFDLNQTSIGPALLNGKMELWRGYPLERNDAYGAYFYFHVYNVLGDPNLKIWRHNPYEMTAEVASELSVEDGTLEVAIFDQGGDGLDGAVLTLTAGINSEIMLARGVSINGWLNLQLNQDLMAGLAGSSAKLTINHIDYLPWTQTIEIGTQSEAVTLLDITIENETGIPIYVAGEQLDLFPRVKNTGSVASSAGTIELRIPESEVNLSGGYTIQTAIVNIPALQAGEELLLSDPIAITLDLSINEYDTLPLAFDITVGTFSHLEMQYLPVRNNMLSLSNLSLRNTLGEVGSLKAWAVDTLVVTLTNTGYADISNASINLIGNEYVTVIAGDAVIEELLTDRSIDLTFVIQGGDIVFSGLIANVDMAIAESGGYSQILPFSIPLGDLITNDPYGPDMGGYYAIESNDYTVLDHPNFNWIELDPEYSGNDATRLFLSDDEVTTVELPFPITMYGQTHNQLSICSNGWVSLGETWMANFRNWNLPSSLGPPNLIAAFWDDLKPVYTENNDSTFVPVYWRFDETEGRITVAWSRCWSRYAWENEGQPEHRFQIVFYDQNQRPTISGDTEFIVQHKAVTDVDIDNNFSTVGIENFGHDIGLQVSYAGIPSVGCAELGAERAILFTTKTPHRDPSLRPEVLYPQPGTWINNTSPLISWDHESYVNLVGTTNIEYQLSISDADFTYVNVGVTGVGELDLAIEEIELPENVQLSLNLNATANGTTVGALQGIINFQIDVSPTDFQLALLRSGLFIDYIEIAALSSERIEELTVVALDSESNVVGEFTADHGPNELGDTQELFYLRSQLHEDISDIVLSGYDAHGVAFEYHANLYVALSSDGNLGFDGISLNWLPVESAGWVVMLAGVHPDENLTYFDSEENPWNMLDVNLSQELRNAQLVLDAPESRVIAKRSPTGWDHVTQSYQSGKLYADIEDSGVYALIDGELVNEIPGSFKLHANFPNPFNPVTQFSFDLPRDGAVQVLVHNINGQLVRTLMSSELTSGSHRMSWEARDESGNSVSSGLYLASVIYEGKRETIKMLLVR